MSTEPWNTNIPDSLNGFPVIAYQEHANGYYTVMMDRTRGYGLGGDYIVATWWPELKDRWQWGHYDLSSLKEADDLFKEVARRNTQR